MAPVRVENPSLTELARLLKPQTIVPLVWTIVLFFVCFPVCMMLFLTPSAMSARSFNAALRSLQEGDPELAATRLRLSLRLNPNNDAARELVVTLLAESNRRASVHSARSSPRSSELDPSVA